MDTTAHDLSNLFRQLGLAAEAAAMEDFLGSHRLPAGTMLVEAAFWSPAQVAFLSEALADDSDWSKAVDELATRLS